MTARISNPFTGDFNQINSFQKSWPRKTECLKGITKPMQTSGKIKSTPSVYLRQNRLPGWARRKNTRQNREHAAADSRACSRFPLRWLPEDRGTGSKLLQSLFKS